MTTGGAGAADTAMPTFTDDEIAAAEAMTLPDLAEGVDFSSIPDEPPPHEGTPFFMVGRTWLVPPLSLGQSRQLRLYTEAIPALRDPDEKSRRMRTVIRIAMQRNYPTLTDAHVDQMVDMGILGDVYGAVLGQSGFRERAMRKEASP